MFIIEHYFKFTQFCYLNFILIDLVVLDGSLTISNFKEIKGIPNLKE